MPVKIGVIGAGKFGTNHLNAFRQMSYTGVAELAAVAEANPARAEEVRKEYGCPVYLDYHEMLEKVDLDGVSVVTPDHLHRQITVDAAKAGKHVLVEKPLDTTVEGCDAMIRAAKDSRVLLQVDFHKRYDPDHRALEARVKAGEMGDILYGSVYMEDRIDVPVDWFPHWAPNSSPTWFLGVHFFDLVRWAIKSEARTVFATGSRKFLKEVHGVDTWDSISAKVDFVDGASFNFDVSWILPRGFESIVNQAIRVVGTKGVWEIDSQDRGSRSCIEDEGMRTYNNNFLREQTDKYGRTVYRGYGAESIEDFAYNVALLKDGVKTLNDMSGMYPSGEDGREVTRIAVAVHESIDTGQVIKLR
ncbi:MAG: Gfo/Idh/MocA family oxidoreductase [Armatimonadota bacterium]|nr:Gfo/Idh/MocA family oxidoreductase [Armatimonadota bacterium]